MDELVFWLKGEAEQNFGDALSLYLSERLFLRTLRRAVRVRIIGSCLHDDFVPEDYPRGRPAPDTREPLIVWGGGIRERGGLTPEKQKRVEILSVRGPLSASELALGAEIPIGDPALFLPALYQPRQRRKFTGKSVCVPHFHDRRPDDFLLAQSGADLVLRPNIGSHESDIEAFIDAIASADFVLSASLHGAIVAAAYKRPFAFWDSGAAIDLPAKWEDFAASVGISAAFASDLAAGLTQYQLNIAPVISLPGLWDCFSKAPYLLRPDAILKLLRYELGPAVDSALAADIAARIAVFEAQLPRFKAIAAESAEAVADLSDEMRVDQKDEDGQREILLAKLNERERRIVELEGGALQIEQIRAFERQRFDEGLRERERRVSELKGSSLQIEQIYASACQRFDEGLREHRRGVETLMEALRQLLAERDRERRQFEEASSQRGRYVAALEQGLESARKQAAELQQSLDALLVAQAKRRSPWRETAGKLRRPWQRYHVRRQIAAVRDSGIFDPAYYLAHNPDISGDPVEHYVLRGAREGRDPHFFFNTEYYLSQLSAPEKIENPLLHFLSQSKWECANPHPLFDCGYYRHRYLQGRREINPLVDFIRHGRAANRVPLSLFDADYYLKTNPQVAASGLDPFLHYVTQGSRARLRAHPLFDVDYYLGANPDVAAAGVDPLLHYILEGGRERRNPHPLFDTGYYLDTNADVAASGMNPLIHYVAYGARERRNPHPLFDAKYYLDQLPDAGTIENPLLHFLSAPNGEDADPHPLFDSAFYRRTYSQGRTDGINSLLHYVTQGARAGHAPNAVFDARGYAFEHPDVDVYGGNALVHYVRCGKARKFAVHPLFEADWYQTKYPDVVATGLDPYAHYVRRGLSEGRLGSRALGDDPDIRAPFPLPPHKDIARVAIVVPAYKSYFDTYRCLTSISRLSGSDVPFKLIVIDDCPERPVGPLLTDHPGVEIVANAENLGFLRTCNRAAEITDEEFILFLNNDTIVTRGWLKSLVDLADRVPRSGMIGGKLLNYDGSVQEAGGTIFRNGWGYPYGRGLDAGLPELNFVREVDCVIGASMLVRRAAFEEVAGFDPRYAPAFYEEFDLAFALQDKGYRVLYQPASEVYHLGSASYGIEVRDRQSAINHGRFVEKWAQRLTTQAEGEADIFRARARPAEHGTILIIDDVVPEYDKHAGALTTTQYMRLLAGSGFKVIYWPHALEATQPYTRELQQAGVEVIYGEVSFSAWLDRAGRFIDFVWVARPDVAPHYIKHIRKKTHARLLYYTHDLHYLREQRRYEIEGDAWALSESKRLKPIEIKIFKSVDCVTTPSADEAEIIAALAPGAEVRVLPPYFYKNAAKPPAEAAPLPLREEIIFVGGYGHVPNVDAAKVLVEEVMPLVWAQVPEARAMLIGSRPPPEVQQLARDRVEVIGFVPQLEPYYARARMSVSPLRYGAGVKGKIVSSLEQGVPVVTTPIGSEGIGLKPGVEVLVGTTPAEIAAHVVRLYKDDALLLSLAEAGRRVIDTRFNEAKAREAFLAALHVKAGDMSGEPVEKLSDRDSQKPLSDDEAGRLFDLQDRDGVFETLIEACYSHVLKAGDSAVDGGAHVGMHTLPMARLVGETGEVFAFEPIRPLADCIASAAADMPQVKVRVEALADVEGETSFHLLSDEPWLSSIARRFVDADKAVEVIEVPRFRLDTLAEKPIRFIKLDLESGDYHALLGATELLRRQKPVIALECGRADAAAVAGYSEDEFFGLFEQLEYHLYDLLGRPFTRDDFVRPYTDRLVPHYLIAVPGDVEHLVDRLREDARAALEKSQP